MTPPIYPVGRTPVGRNEARSTWMTYESFYGLTEKPFSLSSDPRFFYHSPSHTPAFDELLAGILRRESLSESWSAGPCHIFRRARLALHLSMAAAPGGIDRNGFR